MTPTLLKDRYELFETLGAGGEARVVRALDHQHDRMVALKIRPVRSEQRRDELLREARILLGLAPHEMLPFVREDFFADDSYVVVMDWVDGTDLAALLRDRGAPGLPPSIALTYLAQVAEALTFLHAQDTPVVHGDVKPANLILSTGGRIKLVDFGYSSTAGMVGRQHGTVGYRAPELAAGGVPTRASDVYALAATAFALLTGAPPAGSLPKWEGIDPAQARQLERVLRDGLATDPAQRPATPGEFVERLRAGWGTTLPTGVMTFCMSDIVGSTSLWTDDPRAMSRALARHDELIADAVESSGGRFLKSMGEGDSTVSVFSSATAAVTAAYAAAHALADEPWPEALQITARFGLHTGEAERRGSDYFGTTVNLAARVRAEAAGREILVSAATAAVIGDHIPEGCALVDLGPHRLKGLAQPERLYALSGPGLPDAHAGIACPYRGLLPFEAGDRQLFFGREEALASVTQRVGLGRLLAVVGASGSGKSSLLRAGLVGATLAGELPGLEDTMLLTPGPEPPLGLEGTTATLVVVDQFEELYTQCRDAERRELFLDQLLALPSAVVIGIRADFYGELSAHPELAEAVAENHVLLGPMREADLRRAVEEPARLSGLRLEPGLVDLIVRDVDGESAALPLMSHALRATWERRDGRTLTIQAYRETGGVGSAVAQTADAVVGRLSREDREQLKSIFLRLTELGDGVDDTRRRVPIGELVPADGTGQRTRALLDTLVDARLVTVDEDSAEVAHEILIRRWPALREWLDADREGVRLHRRLGDAARLWEASGRERGDLYRGARLETAADWSTSHAGLLNDAERAFLDASLDDAARVRHAERRTTRRLRRLVSGVAVALVAALGLLVIALISRHDSQRNRSLARAQALALASQQQLSSDPVRALLLARAAEQTADTPDARLALRQALDADHLTGAFPRRAPRSCNGSDELVALSGGTQTAKTTCNGLVVIEDAQTHRLVRSIRVGKEAHSLDVSPDGRTLAVTADQSVALVDLVGGRVRSRIAVPVPLFRVDWDPSGELLAFGTPFGAAGWINVPRRQVHVVDRTPGWREARFVSRREIVFGRAWKFMPGPDDTSGGLFTYRIGAGQLRPLLVAGAAGVPYVSALAIRRGTAIAAGQELPTSSAAGRAMVWMVDLDRRRVPTRIVGPAGGLYYSLTASSDARRIAVGAFAGGASIFDANTGRRVLALTGAAGSTNGITEVLRGASVATASSDGATRTYRLAGPDQLYVKAPGHPRVVAQRGRLVLPGPRIETVRLPSGRLGPATSGYDTLPSGATVDDGGRTFLRPGTHPHEIAVVRVGGGVVCHCRYGPPDQSQFLPLRSGRAGVLLVQSPYRATVRATIEAYATHRILRLAEPRLKCSYEHLAATPDSLHLLIVDQCGRGAIWDLRSGAVVARFTPPSQKISTTSGTAGDRFVLGDDDGTAYVYDLRGQQHLALVDGAAAVTAIDADPRGARIATVAADGMLRIWDARRGDLLRRLRAGSGADSVSFAPDGASVYTATEHGLIRGFDACSLCGDGHALLQASDALAVRRLRPEERRTFRVDG